MAELADTLADRLRLRAQAHPGDTAWLQKRHGVWDAWSWERVDRAVDAVALGLRSSGLRDGEAVAIVSGARAEAVLAVLGCQRAGLVPVLLNPNLPPGGLATQAQEAGVAAIVAEDQEQVDKVADVQSRMTGLRDVWVIDPKGTRTYTHIRATPYQSLLESASRGGGFPPAHAALVFFSAGVFGEPRPVAVGHEMVRNHAATAPAIGLRAGERCASLFGLSDPLGHFFAVVAPVLYGTVACFGEGRLPGVPELRQCCPRIVAIPARLLDRLRRETAARANRSGGLRQALVSRWLATDRPSAWLRVLVGTPIANALGLGECRVVMTGHELMAPASARFVARLGIDARGLYVLSEAAGPVGIFAQAGLPALQPFAAYRTHVGAGGELSVQVDGRDVATGDLVTLEGGALHLVGRAADLLTLAGGELLAPASIEAELMASPYINQAVAVGGPAGGVTALVELDEVTLRDWSHSHGLSFTTLRSFAESSEVRRLVWQAVEEANQRLPAAARIVRMVLLPRALEVGNGELTPALAVRRAIVRNRYAHRLVGAHG